MKQHREDVEGKKSGTQMALENPSEMWHHTPRARCIPKVTEKRPVHLLFTYKIADTDFIIYFDKLISCI